MSVNVNDHRRYADGKMAESIKAAEARIEANKQLIAQADSAQAHTGDEHLDKMTRALQELLNKLEDQAKQIAFKGIGCVQEDLIRLQQFEYF